MIIRSGVGSSAQDGERGSIERAAGAVLPVAGAASRGRRPALGRRLALLASAGRVAGLRPGVDQHVRLVDLVVVLRRGKVFCLHFKRQRLERHAFESLGGICRGEKLHERLLWIQPRS